MKKMIAWILVAVFLLPQGAAFSFEAGPVDVLLGEGINYYLIGNDDEALRSFNKVLLIEPYNQKAKDFIREIQHRYGSVTRMDAVTRSLDEVEFTGRIASLKPSAPAPPSRQTAIQKDAVASSAPARDIQDYVSVSGVYQVAAGVRSPDEVVWKEANGDLNERNYRILWGENRHNTFDPAVYDRLQVLLDTKDLSDAGLETIGAHANITVDPWSFTGKSEKFTLAGNSGDRAELELKYWANTSRTVNEVISTLRNGDAIALPEIEVSDKRTLATRVQSTFNNTYDIPSVKIRRSFQPLREFWVESRGESLRWRVFPLAYQDQAYTSDDPLGVSNHQTWWEESPWLAEWKPGRLNTGASPDDFTKGSWDDSLAFFTRDSDGLRLTQLRGFNIGYQGIDGSLEGALASPKNLWSEYGYFDTYAAALRGKYELSYNLGAGATYAGHFGYFDGDLDGLDQVFSLDGWYEPLLGTKFLGQVAVNDASYDRTNDTYKTRRRGNAYLVSMVNRFPAEEIYTQDFGSLKKASQEGGFLKSRFTLARMEDDFNPSLASYRQTRDDEFWSRHISFRKRPLSFYTGSSSSVSFDDIESFAIGTGMDTNRDVVGLRLEGAWTLGGRDLEALGDVRNAHEADTGSFIENVARLELGYPWTDKLTTKFLGIRQDMAKTTEGLDPFIFNSTLNKYLINDEILGNEDPSLATVSFGFDYRLTDKVSFNTVWEHTNDATVGADNYPRGLFNDSSFVTYEEDGKVYRESIPFLYSQQYFDLPPYEYFDIYKFGLSLTPVEELEFYFDMAYNHNRKAGQIDDNMNHYGLEIAYAPTDKVSFLFKYTLSRWLDMVELNASGSEIYSWHHNFFFESRYRLDPTSEFIFDYGVGHVVPLGVSTNDPFGGALAVLDTQHILRLYYRKKF